MKKLIIILILFCCVGCESKGNTLNDKINSYGKAVYETMNGHGDKSIEDAMTVDDAYNLINDVFYYDENEDYELKYYDIVKFAVDKAENDYYAFLVSSNVDENSYYVLVDIYNGMTTFVTAADIGISE